MSRGFTFSVPPCTVLQVGNPGPTNPPQGAKRPDPSYQTSLYKATSYSTVLLLAAGAHLLSAAFFTHHAGRHLEPDRGAEADLCATFLQLFLTRPAPQDCSKSQATAWFFAANSHHHAES